MSVTIRSKSSPAMTLAAWALLWRTCTANPRSRRASVMKASTSASSSTSRIRCTSRSAAPGHFPMTAVQQEPAHRHDHADKRERPEAESAAGDAEDSEHDGQNPEDDQHKTEALHRGPSFVGGRPTLFSPAPFDTSRLTNTTATASL